MFYTALAKTDDKNKSILIIVSVAVNGRLKIDILFIDALGFSNHLLDYPSGNISIYKFCNW